MTSILPLIGVAAGSLVIGYILGHNKGFTDGFDFAVDNSEEVSKAVAKEVLDGAALRIFKKESDGKFTELVEEKPDSVEENS